MTHNSAQNEVGRKFNNTAFEEIVTEGLWDVEIEGNRIILEAREDATSLATEEIVADSEEQELAGEESIAEQELLAVAKPELESDPQLTWPESDTEGVSETTFDMRMNYWLTDMGFGLDAARPHIDSEARAEEWLELKRAVHEAKGMMEWRSKLDVVHELRAAVHDFVVRCGATQADYDEARNG